jgi:uncharacterized protein YndB with AHSA1/START domain
VTDPAAVQIERMIPAPIEEVFQAWIDPATMARWFSPVGQAVVEADVRVGGKFRLTMVGDGVQIDHEGEYMTIERPRLLAFTWRSPYTGAIATTVRVTFEPHGQATRLILVHERLPDETAESHRGGWASILDRLVETLGPGSPTPPG